MKRIKITRDSSLSESDDETTDFYKNQPMKSSPKTKNNTDQFLKLKETGEKLIREGKIPEGIDCYETCIDN